MKRRKSGEGRRKLSIGTAFMLTLTIAVLCGSALVLGRLSYGTSLDLSRLRMVELDIQDDPSRARETESEQPLKATVTPAAGTTAETASAAPRNGDRSFTLCVGGSIALTGEVRKNSQNQDARVADYADVMQLLSSRIRGDVKVVFVENILSDQHKTTDNTAPSSATVLLKEAGFDYAACGFSMAYANGKDGITETLKNLREQEIEALGINDGTEETAVKVTAVNGIRTALLQYTGTIAARTRKSMAKDETATMVPEAEIGLIADDIATARSNGAEAVIILLNWGKTGKDPDKAQRALAEQIALAGADLIIGNGSRVPQGAEYLTGADGKQVLCVWSLGTLISGERTKIRQLSGYLLRITVRSDGQGGAETADPLYIPVYTWKYKQDGRYYYRCLATDGDAPDGMDSDQRKTMNKAMETVDSVLKDTPLVRERETDAD